jgi:hypothetical protein
MFKQSSEKKTKRTVSYIFYCKQCRTRILVNIFKMTNWINRQLHVRYPGDNKSFQSHISIETCSM